MVDQVVVLPILCGQNHYNGNPGGQSQGYPGGPFYSGSGGGGASAAGAESNPSTGGAGGAAFTNLVGKGLGAYAGGGGGGIMFGFTSINSTPLINGSGPGGRPGVSAGGNGTTNTGGGGGGASPYPAPLTAGGSGGSGIVLIRFPAATAPGNLAVGPGTNTLGTNGPTGDKIATFTVSGTLTV